MFERGIGIPFAYLPLSLPLPLHPSSSSGHCSACLPAFWALSHCHLPSFIYELAAPVQVLFWSCGAFLFSFRLLSFCSVSVFYSFAVLLLLSIRYRACCIWRVAFNQLPGTLPSDFLTGHKSGLDRDWD